MRRMQAHQSRLQRSQKRPPPLSPNCRPAAPAEDSSWMTRTLMRAEARALLAPMTHAPHTLHSHLPLSQSTWTAAVMAVLP